MSKPHIAHLTAILAAAAISLPLLASTSSAFAAIEDHYTRWNATLWAEGSRPAQASSVGSVSFAPSDRQGPVRYLDGRLHHQRERRARDRRHHHDQRSRLDDLPFGGLAYKLNGTTVTAIPTTAAGTVTIATPVAVGDSSAISS